MSDIYFKRVTSKNPLIKVACILLVVTSIHIMWILPKDFL